MTRLKEIDFSDQKTLEKFSSAFTLSDMEIFIFPELFYPLVLANIMSPIIWDWRDDPWFGDIDTKSFNYKANRIKQYIIHNFVFNLDLATWGLTTKNRELGRFSSFFDPELLRQSNALFGYEGDSYYFDIDIRKHFGLDKFDSDIIPYWKTETVEAMAAFRHKKNFSRGAGECVSLSALYAAAMFIVGRIPLEKIFLIATPLHSQNFIPEREGLITNNRRIVTKNMWFNGTSLSEKARRALENERVTIVSHISGYIHILYEEATISKKCYLMFSEKLKQFLVTELTDLVFINFLRFKPKYKTLFQYRCHCTGVTRYISLEKMFEYEHTSRFNVSQEKRGLLVREIEGDEFHLSPLPGKAILNDIEKILNDDKIKNTEEFAKEFSDHARGIPATTVDEMMKDLERFISTKPRLPDENKIFIRTAYPEITINDDREKIISAVKRAASNDESALLALYVYRHMDEIDWVPFLKAAIERNPVCFDELAGKPDEEVYRILTDFPDESIYDNNRLALPDEVWNFRRGDGVEKALLLADVMICNNNKTALTIEIDNKNVLLKSGESEFRFVSKKSLTKKILISENKYRAELLNSNG